MSITNSKSIIIEGDKTLFSTKAAVDRLKRDLREDNKKKLNVNDYFKEGVSYNIISDSDTEMKIQLVNIEKTPIIDKESNKKILKEKLKMMRQNKLSFSQITQNLKNKVPSDVLDAYIQLKKVHLKIQIPQPDVVLSKPDEFKTVIYSMIQSFGMFKGKNNLIVNYYRLLAKHLGLPTAFVPPNPQIEQSNNPSNEFIEMLRKQRNDNETDEIDDEMSKIYDTLGINTDDKPEEIDEEMSEIYKSLCVNSENKMTYNNKIEEIDEEMTEIYKSLGVQIKDSALEVDI
jgi:hypothetical protein